jgi:ubiquinone/menaquinone biosynthesis C-methylase UbiE
MDISAEMVARFNDLQSKLVSGNASDIELNEALKIAEQLMSITGETYNIISKRYAHIRGEEPNEGDKKDFERLLSLAREKVKLGLLGDKLGCLYLLDVGTGSGRDIKFATKFSDLKIIGIDNSDSFIQLLKNLESNKEIPKGCFVKADMRDLSYFSDGHFDIVRNNASLVHLPIIKKGYMADLAISECHRVLKNNGIIYLLVKEGVGTEFIDTEEGLGRRFYQLFTEESIRELVNRNGFINTITWKRRSSRNENIKWIALIAEKI